MKLPVHVSYNGREIIVPATTFFEIFIDLYLQSKQIEGNCRVLKKKPTPHQAHNARVVNEILAILPPDTILGEHLATLKKINED
jgi:hypothetical protein